MTCNHLYVTRLGLRTCIRCDHVTEPSGFR